MLTPSIPAIFKALFAWSHAQKISDDEVKKMLIARNVKGVKENFDNWVLLAQSDANDGKCTLPLADFAKVLECFGFKDLDTFIDLAWSFDHSMSGPLYIPHNERVEKFYQQNEKDKPSSSREVVSPKTWLQLLETKKLNGHRFIIDRIKLPPKGVTIGGQHYGFEAVYMEKGSVRIEFGGKYDGHLLEENDFISFNSREIHQAINVGNKVAVLFVARTLRSDEYKTEKDNSQVH